MTGVNDDVIKRLDGTASLDEDRSSRRAVLRLLGRLGLGAIAAPCVTTALAQSAPSVATQCHRAFREALAKAPWLEALASVDDDRLPPLALSVQGRIPAALTGTLYRNGPAGYQRGGQRYQHWFDGDGMIQAFRIDKKGITHRASKVQTAKYREERTAGRLLYNGAGSLVDRPRRARDNDAINAANISVVRFEDRLLALWEAGSAYPIDPQSLATDAPVVWSPETEKAPFSAHPAIEPSGDLWNFGLAQWTGENGLLLLYHVRERRLVKVAPIPMPYRGYVHSIAATATKLVLYLSPNVLDPEAPDPYVAKHRWRPSLGGRLLVVDKNDFGRFRWHDAPAGFVFHILGAVDEAGGGLRVQACWNPTAEIMNSAMTAIMWGKGPLPVAQLTTLHLPAKSDVQLERHDLHGELPAVDPRPSPSYGRRTYMLYRKGAAPWVNAVGACDTKTGRIDGFSFGTDVLVEEHVFVPRKRGASPDDGWLIGPFFDASKGRSGLSIFDTRRIADGPVVTATMARTLPLGFHGCFWPAAA